MKILTKDYWTVYRQTYAMQLVVSGIAAAMDLKIWFGMCAVMFLLVYIEYRFGRPFDAALEAFSNMKTQGTKNAQTPTR